MDIIIRSQIYIAAVVLIRFTKLVNITFFASFCEYICIDRNISLQLLYCIWYQLEINYVTFHNVIRQKDDIVELVFRKSSKLQAQVYTSELHVFLWLCVIVVDHSQTGI